MVKKKIINRSMRVGRTKNFSKNKLSINKKNPFNPENPSLRTTEKIKQKLSQWNPYRPGELVIDKKNNVQAWFNLLANENTSPTKKQMTLEKLHNAAEKGESHAQNNLGIIYYEGIYVSSDYLEGKKWLSQAAEQGNVTAQYNLGKIYYEGQYVTQDCELAIKLFVKVINQRKCDEQLLVSAKFKLFVLFLYQAEIITSDDIIGINKLLHGITTTRGAFSRYISHALENEQISILTHKFLKFVLPKISFILDSVQPILRDIEDKLDVDVKDKLDNKKHKKLFISFINYITKGFNPTIIEKIQKEKIEIIRQSAIEGDAFAQVSLGNFYLKGSDGMTEGIQGIQELVLPVIAQIKKRFYNAKDEINKISDNTQWFEQFNLLENILNQVRMIGLIQEFVPQQDYQPDEQQAAEWFIKAAKQGLPKAQYLLATLYTEGKGVPENTQEAIELFKKVINEPTDENNETKFITVLSQYELGKIYKKQAKYQEAKEWLEKVSKFNDVINEELYEKIYARSLNDTKKSAQEMLIDIVKIEEEEKSKQELEEVMGMFAHKFRGSLQSIQYLEKDETILEDVSTMDGLLEIFSLISAETRRIREGLLQDMTGEGTLLLSVQQSLIMSLASVLTKNKREKIRQHYLNYAKKTEQVLISTTRKQWRDDYFDLELQLQADWQRRFIEIKRQPSLDKIVAWLNERFFPIEIQGFAEAPIHFERYGATESVLLVVMPEIFTNVLKYYASETQQAVQLRWIYGREFCQFSCTNPTTDNEQQADKGSGKGHQFLSLIARKLGGHFPKPPFVDNYRVEFNIPNYLLIKNNYEDQ